MPLLSWLVVKMLPLARSVWDVIWFETLVTIGGIYFSPIHSDLFSADINLQIFIPHDPMCRMVFHYGSHKMSFCAIQMSWPLVFMPGCSHKPCFQLHLTRQQKQQHLNDFSPHSVARKLKKMPKMFNTPVRSTKSIF